LYSVSNQLLVTSPRVGTTVRFFSHGHRVAREKQHVVTQRKETLDAEDPISLD
jgi:hypothetical protein